MNFKNLYIDEKFLKKEPKLVQFLRHVTISYTKFHIQIRINLADTKITNSKWVFNYSDYFYLQEYNEFWPQINCVNVSNNV